MSSILITLADDGQRFCLKHVESYSKNKFKKLVLLVGFIIRTYHNARSSQYQIWYPYTSLQETGVFKRYASSKTFVSCHVHFVILIICHLLWFQSHLDSNIINLESITYVKFSSKPHELVNPLDENACSVSHAFCYIPKEIAADTY